MYFKTELTCNFERVQQLAFSHFATALIFFGPFYYQEKKGQAILGIPITTKLLAQQN